MLIFRDLGDNTEFNNRHQIRVGFWQDFSASVASLSFKIAKFDEYGIGI